MPTPNKTRIFKLSEVDNYIWDLTSPYLALNNPGVNPIIFTGGVTEAAWQRMAIHPHPTPLRMLLNLDLTCSILTANLHV